MAVQPPTVVKRLGRRGAGKQTLIRTSGNTPHLAVNLGTNPPK